MTQTRVFFGFIGRNGTHNRDENHTHGHGFTDRKTTPTDHEIIQKGHEESMHTKQESGAQAYQHFAARTHVFYCNDMGILKFATQIIKFSAENYIISAQKSVNLRRRFKNPYIVASLFLCSKDKSLTFVS